jgi:hypothetical protein
MRSVFLFFAIIGAYLAASSSHAQEVFTYTQNANTWTFGSQPLTAANVPKIAFASNGTPLLVRSTRAIAAGGGVNIPISATATVSSPNIGRALGRFALKAGGALVVGVALYDLAKELGFLVDNSTGQLVVQQIETVGTFRYACFQGSGSGLTSDGGCLGLYLEANRRFNPKCAASQGPYNTGTAVFQGVPYAFNSIATGDLSNCPLSPVISTRTMISTAPSTEPATLQELEDAIARQSTWPSSSSVGRALTDAINSGEVVPLSAPTITGPLTVPLAPVVVQNPDGSVTTTTREKVLTYGPDGTVSTSTRETTSTTSPTGVTSPGPVVTRPDEPIVITPDPATQPAPEPEPSITCGLPDTPACILDGSGIPTAQSVPTDTLERAHDPIRDIVQDPSSVLPQLPTISWLFALPTYCGPIEFGGAFDPYLSSIDVCRFQPMFHEIMSLVWALGGLFGAISMFMRSTPT